MLRSVWVMIIVCVVMLGSVALGLWLIAQRGYPNTVYFERVVISGSAVGGIPQATEIWVDPHSGRELRRTNDAAGPYTSLIVAGTRHEYTIRNGIIFDDAPIPSDSAQSLLADWRALARGGFHALGAYRLAHAVGSIQRVRFGDRQAIRFDTDRHDLETQQLRIWLDARTGAPLQLELQGFGYSLTQRVLSTRRIAPGSLPAAFFDLPSTHPSYWDQAVGWARERLGLSH